MISHGHLGMGGGHYEWIEDVMSAVEVKYTSWRGKIRVEAPYIPGEGFSRTGVETIVNVLLGTSN